VSFVGNGLPVMDSNHVLEVQSPASCRVDEPGSLKWSMRLDANQLPGR